MQNLNTIPSTNIFRGLAATASALVLAGLLTGCGGALSNAGGTGGGGGVTVRFQGNVHGGQQPVNGATIQLYTVGVSGEHSASTPLIAAGSVMSDANGNFSITGKYDCTTIPATQVYIVATGGDPGAGTNTALSLMAALGSCATLQANAATTFIQINEVTTVAAAYALAPFASDYTHIGNSGFASPNVIVDAFMNAALLANNSTGTAGGAGLATGVTIPVSEINTLANIIASCVNTTGAASSQCSTLFSATGATDTFGAALAIAKNPGAPAITGLYTLSSAIAPFQPSMSTQPNDFTVAVNMTAGGALSTPYGIAIDALGNAWVTNETGTSVTEVSPSGAVLATPTAPGLVGAQGIAVDSITGNIWVANTAGNSVVKFTLTNGLVTAANSFTAGGVTAPTAIALDGAGNVFVANFNGNSVTGLTQAGTARSGSPFTGNGNILSPVAIAVAGPGQVFVTSGNGSLIKLSNSGVYISTLTDGTLQGPQAVGIDGSGHVFLSGFTTGTTIAGAVSEFDVFGTPSAVSPASAGSSNPAGVATDDTSAWVANSVASGSLVKLQFGSATPLSPVAGYGLLNTPVGVALDSTGSVWTANSGSNTLTKFIGLAQEVNTPISADVGS
jgi:hypothetical protein